MSQILRIETTILPGRRIEITSPDLPESGPVEVVVVVPAPSAESGTRQDQGKSKETILEFLDRLPVRHHSAEWWAQREAELVKDRDSWDR
jgi:hypothetical protein